MEERCWLSTVMAQKHWFAESFHTEVMEELCIKKIELNSDTKETSREAFLAFRPIPLNENPGLRPIWIGEVLRGIAGKVMMQIVKKYFIKAAGRLRLCTGQGGNEPAVHAMHEIFDAIRLKQYYLSTLKMHSIPSIEKYYFEILDIYV